MCVTVYRFGKWGMELDYMENVRNGEYYMSCYRTILLDAVRERCKVFPGYSVPTGRNLCRNKVTERSV